MGRRRRHMPGKDGTAGAGRTVHRDDASESIQHASRRTNPPLPASGSVRSAHVGAHRHGAAVADGALLTEQVATIARAAATDWPADVASRAGECVQTASRAGAGSSARRACRAAACTTWDQLGVLIAAAANHNSTGLRLVGIAISACGAQPGPRNNYTRGQDFRRLSSHDARHRPHGTGCDTGG